MVSRMAKWKLAECVVSHLPAICSGGKGEQQKADMPGLVTVSLGL